MDASNPNKPISNVQEFFIFLQKKDSAGTLTDIPELMEWSEAPTTILLSEIAAIYRLHQDDWAYKETEETRVYFKNDVRLDLVVKYEDLRKVWMQFLKQ